MTTNLQEIYNEWQNNPRFREQFKKNPEQALKEAGFEVSPDDLKKIKGILHLKDEEFDKRINK